MPLSKIQSDVLRLLASNRDPKSDVAGSTPLYRNAPRYSSDIDIFHDREERVREAAEKDAGLLEENGFTLHWHRCEPLIYTVFVSRPGESTKLEWVADSDYRFFPTIPDEAFGDILHPADLDPNHLEQYETHGGGSADTGRRAPRFPRPCWSVTAAARSSKATSAGVFAIGGAGGSVVYRKLDDHAGVSPHPGRATALF